MIKVLYILFEETIKQLKGIILIILFFDDYFSKYAFLFFLLSEQIIVSIWKYYSYIIISINLNNKKNIKYYMENKNCLFDQNMTYNHINILLLIIKYFDIVINDYLNINSHY